MASRIPVRLVAEFRGLTPPSQFTARDTAQVVQVPAKYKFEVALDASDDVELLVLSETALERASDWPLASLRRGDRVQIDGHVALQDRGSDRDSFLHVASVVQLPDVSAVVKAPAKAA